MMRVGFFSVENQVFSNWGGIATFSNNLTHLLSENNQVYFFTYSSGDYKVLQINKNLTNIYIPLKFESKIANFLYFKILFFFPRVILNFIAADFLFFWEWNLFVLYYFHKYYRKESFTSFHSDSYNFSAFFTLFFYNNIYHVVHNHGPRFLFTQFNKSPVFIFFAKLERLYLTYIPNKIISCSKRLLEDTKKHITVHNVQFSYAYNFNQSHFLNSEVNSNHLIFFGRKEQRKGVDILIKVFIKLAKQNSKIKLFLIGDEGYFFKGSEMIPFSQLFLTLTKTVDPSILNRIISIPQINDRKLLDKIIRKIAGVVVCPSVCEPFGYVYLESVKLGLLTLISKNSGFYELYTEGFEELCFSPNFNDLYFKVTNIISLSNEKLKRLQQQQQSIIKELVISSDGFS